MSQEPQLMYSPDRRYWWDGYRWQPVPQPTPKEEKEFSLAHRLLSAIVGGGLIVFLGWILVPAHPILGGLVFALGLLLAIVAVFPPIGDAAAHGLGHLVGFLLVLVLGQRRAQALGRRIQHKA